METSVTATPSTVIFTTAGGSVAAGIDGVAAPALGGHLTTLCDTPLSSTSPVVSTSTSTVTRLSTTAVEFVPTLVSHSVTPPTLTTVSKTVTSPVSNPGVYDSSGVPVPSSAPAVVTGSGGAACVSSRVEDTGVSASEPMSDSIMETFTRLLKAQTDVLAAQACAVSVQNLPGLSCYTGEGDDATDGGFDHWLERFHARAVFAGWSSEEKLYQMKAHLDKTALNVFRMLPDQDRDTFDTAVSALKKRFRPADIEELRGLEFHHRTQGDGESIEQVGISIQQLGRKAFPSITGKDFDRLLKGRFYQALMVKWQRKLGCPKPDEGFHELLARARMLEEHEKQFAVSVQSRNEH